MNDRAKMSVERRQQARIETLASVVVVLLALLVIGNIVFAGALNDTLRDHIVDDEKRHESLVCPGP